MSGLFMLGGDLALADPAFLLLLLVLPLLWLWRRRRRVRPALLWGSLAGRLSLPRGWRTRLPLLLSLVEIGGVLLLVVALARPQEVLERVEHTAEGVDIVVCLDISTSMRFPDMDAAEERSRLQVVKEVADRFIAGRRRDRVGLVTFARFPRIVCPPTLDLEAARRFLQGVELVQVKEADGTGIGAGLMRAVAMLHQSEAKSRVVILLTDGRENIHWIEPLEAARAAKGYDVRVHTIAAGQYQYRPGFGGGFMRLPLRLDTSELEEMAELTRGRFFRARDAEALAEIWAEIDRMEKYELEDRRWVDATDLAAPVIAAGTLLLLAAGMGRFLGGLP